MENNDLSTGEREEKERVPGKNPSSAARLDERLDLQETQNAKKTFPSLPFSFFPPTHNVASLSADDHSSLSFIDEPQQYFHHPLPSSSSSSSSLHYDLYSSEQVENIEDKSHLCSLFDKFKQVKTSEDSDLSDILEENSSFSSVYSLSDTIKNNDDNENSSPLLTSTPILPFHHQRTAKVNLFSPQSTEKTRSYQLLPSTFGSNDEDSSTISTIGLVNDLQHQAQICQLNPMSSLTNSPNTHTYDQRITDQGHKYIIQLKTDEFQEHDFILTPRYSFHQLIIEAKHREDDTSGGYVHRELRKIFNIPKHIDLHQYTYSYQNEARELTIEMPYLSSIPNDTSYLSSINNTTELSSHSSGKFHQISTDDNPLPVNSIRSDESANSSGIGSSNLDSTLSKSKPFDFDLFHRSAFRPQIVRATSKESQINEKKLLMSLDLSDYQAEDIKVSVKDRELIVKAERKIETETRKSRTSFFQSTSLPPQTDIEHLRSNFDHGKLVIEAPYLEHNSSPLKLHQGNQW